eukprot:scaffold56381_cov40-Prasinocladus_malaysianus.AAC.1
MGTPLDSTPACLGSKGLRVALRGIASRTCCARSSAVSALARTVPGTRTRSSAHSHLLRKARWYYQSYPYT